MKVILKEDVKNLGIMGSIVNVADGYGRNFLIPRNLAVAANQKNIKQYEHEKNIIMEKVKKVQNSAEELADRLSKITLNISVNAGEDNKIFGSVTAKDVAEAVSKHGIDIDKRKVILPDDNIKRLGTYTVQVKIHPEVTAKMNLEVHSAEKPENPAE